MSRETEEIVDETPEGELVHWMTPKRLGLALPAVSSAVLGAFLLGAASAVAVLAASGRLAEPRRLKELPRFLRRG